jgi:hypothetical protein
MNERTIHTPGQSWQSVWSPGFSRYRALNENDSEHLEDSGVNGISPAKAGTPYPCWSFAYEICEQDGSRSTIDRSWGLEPGVFRSVIGTLLLLFALSFPFRVGAQTNGPAAGAPSNRYLFIMNTSRAMQPRADGALKAMQDLLASGMGGQLRRGDTLGVWTFNHELNAGHFPLQRWSPETHRAVAIRILTFLKDQKYEKRASLDKVLPAMEGVIKDSDFITVILVSDGNQKIRGTPFDDRINHFYKLWHGEQQTAQMPFITVLRARNGSITDHSVTSAPWPVEMPPLPFELAGPPAREKNTAPAQPPAPSAPVFSGKKSESVQPSKPADASAVPVQSEPAQHPNVETAEARKTEPAPISPEKLPAEAVPGPPASPVSSGEPKIPKAAAPKSDGSALAEPQSSPSVVAPAAPSNSAADPPSSILDARSPTPGASSPSASAPPSSKVPSSWSPSTMPGLTAVGTFLSDNKIWVAAVVLAGMVFGFVILLMRGRSRPSGRISLTRSADHDQK